MDDSIYITVFYDEVFRVYFLTAREALRRFARVAFRIERDLNGRAFVFARLVELLFSYLFHAERQTTRRCVYFYCFKREAKFSEARACERFHLREDARNKSCRDLFCTNFQQ